MAEVPRKTKYDGATVVLPDVSHVRPGDILLTFNAASDDRKGSKKSRLITRATGGRFSHAMICSSPPTFVEAIGPGVSALSLARCFAHSFDHVRVLRWPDEEVAAKAARLAQMEVGRDYSVTKAITSVFPRSAIDNIADKGIFCSALVAQVFTAAGATAFEKTAVEKTTPATIDQLDGLEDITSKVFRAAPAPSNIEQMCALDGDRVGSLSERQTGIEKRYARELTPTAMRMADAYPETGLAAPITFLQTIEFIMDATDQAPKIVRSRRSAFKADLAALDQQAAELISSGELSDLLREIIELDDEGLQRNLLESFRPRPDIDILAMRSYLTTTESQLHKRGEAIESFMRWGVKRSRTVAAYVAYQLQTLGPIERRLVLLKEILARIG